MSTTATSQERMSGCIEKLHNQVHMYSLSYCYFITFLSNCAQCCISITAMHCVVNHTVEGGSMYEWWALFPHLPYDCFLPLFVEEYGEKSLECGHNNHSYVYEKLEELKSVTNLPCKDGSCSLLPSVRHKWQMAAITGYYANWPDQQSCSMAQSWSWGGDHWLLQIGLQSPGHGSTLLTWSVGVISSDYCHLTTCLVYRKHWLRSISAYVWVILKHK